MERKTVSISLPPESAKYLDKVAKKYNFSRSELARFIFRRFFDQNPDLSLLADKGGGFEFLKKEPDLYTSEDVRD